MPACAFLVSFLGAYFLRGLLGIVSVFSKILKQIQATAGGFLGTVTGVGFVDGLRFF